MVEEKSKKNNRQIPKDRFKTKFQNFFFLLKAVLIHLYIFPRYLAVKSLILVKGLVDLTILPVLLILAVFSGFLSEKISIGLTILIYCIFTYQISPKLLKPLYRDFGELWWVRIIVAALACVFCVWFYYADIEIFFDYPFLPIVTYAMILLLGIPIGKMMLNKSDMVEWIGAVPTCFTFVLPNTEKARHEKEDVRREYKVGTNYSLIHRKLLRFLPWYVSGIIFVFVCVALGALFTIFLYSTILFVIFISVWLLNDLYYVIKNKRLFKFEALNRAVRGGHAYDKEITSSLFSFKAHSFIKQVSGIVCLFSGILPLVIFSISGVVIFASAVAVLIQSPSGILFFISPYGILFIINEISLVLASIFQLYFWYILVKRFPHFLDVWSGKALSMEQNIPRLPTDGFLIFLVNFVVIILLFFCCPLWSVGLHALTLPPIEPIVIETVSQLILTPEYFRFFGLPLYAFLFRPILDSWTASSMAILILAFSFEIYLIRSIIKNRKLKETDPNNLYKDNKRIPFAAGIQSLSFFALTSVILSIFVFYLRPMFQNLGGGLDRPMVFSYSESLLLSIFPIICFVTILFFYIADIERLTRKKYPEKSVDAKRWGLYFIITVMIFVSGLASQMFWICYLGLFGTIFVAIGFILTIIMVLRDDKTEKSLCNKPKTHATKKQPKK